jgi:hypothetical protein
MSTDMVRLSIDFENPASEWWEGGGRDLWESIVEGFDNNDALIDRALAESWLVQAAQVPGWDGGPDYSPNPIRMVEIDEDEEL